MQSSSYESSPSTRQQDTKSVSSVQNPPVQNTNGLNLQFLALHNIPPWAKLVLGSIVLLAIPLYKSVLRTQNLKKRVEAAVEVAEMAVEAAEKVAKAAEKVVEAAENAVGRLIEELHIERMKEAEENAEGVDFLINTVDELEIKLKLKNGEEKMIAVKAVAS